MRKFGWAAAMTMLLAGSDAMADGVATLTLNCAAGLTCTSTSFPVNFSHLTSVSCEWSSGSVSKAEFVITDPSQTVTDKQYFIVSADERKARVMSRLIQRRLDQGSEMGMKASVAESTANVKITSSTAGANRGTCYVGYGG